MQLKKIVLCITCLFVHLNGNQQPSPRIIFTVLDDSEPSLSRNEKTEKGTLKEGLGIIATELLIALAEEQCIIIVNSSVVHYLMRYMQEVSSNPLGLIPSKNINPKNWIKKKISDYLYILLPKEYIRCDDFARAKELKQSNPTMLDEQELAIGIRFKSLRDISDSDFIQPNYHRNALHYPAKEREEEIQLQRSTLTFTQELSWISHHCIDHLNGLFISKKKYTHFPDSVPQFIFIATGHGSPYYAIAQRIRSLEHYGQDTRPEIKRLRNLQALGKTAYYGGIIAGFNSNDFGTFVTFLAENLSVKLLFFNTCYGAELNVQEALGKRLVPFTIISGVLSSGSSNGRIERRRAANGYNHTLTVSLTKPIFKNFFDVLATNAVQSDDVLFKAIDFIYPYAEKDDTSYNNMLSIKRPGQPWKVLKRPHIITLDETLANQQNGKPFDVLRAFGDRTPTLYASSTTAACPHSVLMQTNKIPYELTFSGTWSLEMPAFISVVPGDAIHYFAKIDARIFSISEFSKAFFKIPDLIENKTFVIDTLLVRNTIKNVLQSPADVVVLTNVVISHEVDTATYPTTLKKSVFFEYNGTGWYIMTDHENYPPVHYMKQSTTPENILHVLHQVAGGIYQPYVPLEEKDADIQDTHSDLEQIEQYATIPETTFMNVCAWLYSLLC